MSTSYATNILQTVTTFNESSLGYLQNENCFVEDVCNKKFQNFQSLTANLGSSVSLDLPYRFTTTNTLVASWQTINQRAFNLTCDNSSNTSVSFNNQQDIFNLDADSYIKKMGMGAMQSLGAKVEARVALNLISAMTNDPEFGSTKNVQSGPYRFFGDSDVDLDSYTKLAQGVAKFKNYGADISQMKCILPDMIIPSIIGTGQNQFVPQRNENDFRTWNIGTFGQPPVKYYSSNVLPQQIAGTVGATDQTLTLVSTNDPTGQNVTALTFSGATADDLAAIKAGDVFSFDYGVANLPNVSFLTFTGYTPTSQKVQFRALNDAAADGSGNVTFSILPALNWAGGQTQNLTTALQTGMQATGQGSHYAGCLLSGGSFYLAMPRLPEESPYASSSKMDEDTGVSLRLTYGSIFGQNQMGFIYSTLYGAFLHPEYCMRYIIPVSQIENIG